MGFIVKQMMDEPIILITYRRFDSTVDEAIHQAKKIGDLLREMGDFGYIILDISGHRNSFRALYDTLQDVLKEDAGKISNPSQSIVIVGSSALVDYHQAETESHKTERFAWIVTNDASHAMELVQAKLDAGEHPAQVND